MPIFLPLLLLLLCEDNLRPLHLLRHGNRFVEQHDNGVGVVSKAIYTDTVSRHDRIDFTMMDTIKTTFSAYYRYKSLIVPITTFWCRRAGLIIGPFICFMLLKNVCVSASINFSTICFAAPNRSSMSIGEGQRYIDPSLNIRGFVFLVLFMDGWMTSFVDTVTHRAEAMFLV